MDLRLHSHLIAENGRLGLPGPDGSFYGEPLRTMWPPTPLDTPSLSPPSPSTVISPESSYVVPPLAMIRQASGDSLSYPSDEEYDASTRVAPVTLAGSAMVDSQPSDGPTSAAFAHNFYDPFKTKHRRRTSPQQLAILEWYFDANPKPDGNTRKTIAAEVVMTTREVQVWFQNRRAKVKKLEKRAAEQGAKEQISLGSPAPLNDGQLVYGRRISDTPAIGGTLIAVDGPALARRASMPVAIPRVPPMPELSPHRSHSPRAYTMLMHPNDLRLDLEPVPLDIKPERMPTPPPMNYSELSVPSSAASTTFSSFQFGTAPSWPAQGLYTHPQASHSQTSLWDGSANFSYASSVAEGSDTDSLSFALPASLPVDRRASCPAEFIANFNSLGMPTSHPIPPTPSAAPSSAPFSSQAAHAQSLAAAAYNMRRHSVTTPLSVPRHLQASPLVPPSNIPAISRRASCAAPLDPIAEQYSPTIESPTSALPTSFYNYEIPSSDDTVVPQPDAQTRPDTSPFGRQTAQLQVARRARSIGNLRGPYGSALQERRGSRPDGLSLTLHPPTTGLSTEDMFDTPISTVQWPALDLPA